MRSAIRSPLARRLLRAFDLTGTASGTWCTVARWSCIGLLMACSSLPAHADNTSSSSNMSAIGRQVFSDPSLSADGRVACASCHRPGQSFTDGLPLAVQLAGRYADEATLIRLGAQLEAARPWFGRKPALVQQRS